MKWGSLFSLPSEALAKEGGHLVIFVAIFWVARQPTKELAMSSRDLKKDLIIQAFLINGLSPSDCEKDFSPVGQMLEKRLSAFEQTPLDLAQELLGTHQPLIINTFLSGLRARHPVPPNELDPEVDQVIRAAILRETGVDPGS